MSYLAPKKKTSYKGLLLSLILPAVFFLIIHLLFPNLISGMVIRLFSPFWEIQREIEKDEYMESLQKDFFDNALVRENIELKQILGRNDTLGEDPKLLAVVIKRPPYSPYDSLIIDIGKKDGVYDGAKVYAKGYLYIGTVEKTYDDYSKVILISSPSMSVDVDVYIDKDKLEKIEDNLDIDIDENVVATSSASATTTRGHSVVNLNGIKNGVLPTKAYGRGGGSFEIVVPGDTPVDVGADVVVPDIQTLPIGKVESVVLDEGKSFKSLFFKFPVSIYEIKYVQVNIKK